MTLTSGKINDDFSTESSSLIFLGVTFLDLFSKSILLVLCIIFIVGWRFKEDKMVYPTKPDDLES